MTLADRLKERISSTGTNMSRLAKAVHLSPQAISKLVSGEARSSAHLHKIARELGTTVEYLTGETNDPEASVGEARVAWRAQADALADNDLVPVQEIDLSYGMGGTFLDIPVTETTRHWPREFLEQYTRASSDKLFFARGSGDSMLPTIADSDVMLIDTSQNTINMGEKIWAVAYGDVGMIKRVRPLPDGTVELHSDNALISTIHAADGEMTVIGRVVARIGKL